MLLAFSGYLTLGQCSLNELPVHPGVGGFYKGPNSETIIKGPDGSVITAQAEGGSIATHDLSQPIVVADTVDVEPLQSVEPIVSVTPAAAEPVVTVTPVVAVSPIATASPVVAAAPVAVVAPVLPVAAAAPVIPHTIEVIRPDPHIIETEIVDAPVVEPQESTDLVGPSGSISTRGSSSIVSGPASTTISGKV